MRIVADDSVIRWLLDSWSGELEWDQGNLVKLKKHHATRQDIGYLFTEIEADAVFVGRIVPQDADPWPEPRYLTFGLDMNDKPRAIVWTIRGDRIRPISCRIMRRGERKLYESIR